MTTVLNRDSIQVKRDLQRRIEDYVAGYCKALEENFKQYSINSFKRSIDALEVDLWNKVERYIGVPLARLEYCKNRPHALTAFK